MLRPSNCGGNDETGVPVIGESKDVQPVAVVITARARKPNIVERLGEAKFADERIECLIVIFDSTVLLIIRDLLNWSEGV